MHACTRKNKSAPCLVHCYLQCALQHSSLFGFYQMVVHLSKIFSESSSYRRELLTGSSGAGGNVELTFRSARLEQK